MAELVWKVNGLEIPFDISEAGFNDRFDAALENVRNLPDISPENAKNSDFIRNYCKTFRGFYADLFGTDTTEKLFAKTPDSVLQYNQMFLDLLTCKAKQEQELDAFFMRFLPRDGLKKDA